MIARAASTMLVLGVFAVCNAHAQSYTLVPGDSIVGDVLPEDLTVFNFEQHNQTTETLTLTWQKLTADIPAGWEATMCDNAICYTGMQETSTQTVLPGEYGLASLHVTAHSAGTAIVRYILWGNADASNVDTLTWVITSEPLGLATVESKGFSVMQNVNGLVVKFNQPADRIVSVFNANGQLLTRTAYAEALVVVETSQLPSGLYVMQSRSGNSIQNFKLIVQP